MIIDVDPSSGIPVYRQLMDQVRFHIASGLIGPGDAIPSTRSLSARLGINPMTISKAFSLLEAEGVLERRPGLPLVVKQGGGDGLRETRIEQLRSALRPIATMARQLDIDSEAAAALFKKLLDDSRRQT